jgi:hypothetical protein
MKPNNTPLCLKDNLEAHTKALKWLENKKQSYFTNGSANGVNAKVVNKK